MYYESIQYIDGVPCLRTHYFTDIPYSDNDTYIKVDEKYKNRLDKVAYDFYNNVALWWVIAHASNIRNPFNVPIGTVLRIPPYTTLFRLKGIEI